MSVEVRRALVDDASQLLPLIREHAIYERSAATITGTALHSALVGDHAPLRAWLAANAGSVIGYATATVDFSTWTGRYFLHLDCLFVSFGHRGQRVGARLFGAVRAYAAQENISELQWQTPSWNKEATRFYLREGAAAASKVRFTLAV